MKKDRERVAPMDLDFFILNFKAIFFISFLLGIIGKVIFGSS